MMISIKKYHLGDSPIRGGKRLREMYIFDTKITYIATELYITKM